MNSSGQGVIEGPYAISIMAVHVRTALYFALQLQPALCRDNHRHASMVACLASVEAVTHDACALCCICLGVWLIFTAPHIRAAVDRERRMEAAHDAAAAQRHLDQQKKARGESTVIWTAVMMASNGGQYGKYPVWSICTAQWEWRPVRLAACQSDWRTSL